MHENNFEDQVHDKMRQLGFDPSDAVWTAVEKEINKDKKRRKPFLIIFFLSGLLLAGGGIYFALIKNSPGKMIAGQTSKDSSESNNKQSDHNSQPAKIQTNKSTNVISNTNDHSIVKNPNMKTGTNANDQHAVKRPKTGQNNPSVLITAGIQETESNITQNNLVPPGKPEPDNSGRNSYDSSLTKKEIITVEKKDFAKNSVSDLKKAPPEKHKISIWKIAFTGSAGISDIHQSLFKPANNTGSYYFTPANGASGGTPAPVPVSSEINTGFSFIAGLTVNRYLSKRISLSAGLNYHYYSTHIQTGYAVDSSITVFNSYSSLAPAYLVNGFYQNGAVHNYTNHYHFIELPVSVSFRLNKNDKLPVYWEADLSLSYLINTNALFFDPNGNLYYQNKELFNRTQLSGITSILIGIPVHKSELQLGPQLQYGFTGLLKSGVSSEHLFFGGVKISYVLPWK
jgi:Outer membrane protein beta-barrel domain